VAGFYASLADAFVLDSQDAAQAEDVAALGLRPVVTNTVMTGPAEREALAGVVLRAAGLRWWVAFTGGGTAHYGGRRRE